MSESEILGLEDKRFGAMTAKDWKALDALLHDQLLYTHSTGVTDTKAVWMDAMKGGRTVYKSVKNSDRKVRIYGDNALAGVIHGLDVELATANLRLELDAAYTRQAQVRHDAGQVLGEVHGLAID
jgi:hypothetical protein